MLDESKCSSSENIDVLRENVKFKIDEYNKNPNLCLFCNKPILATYDKRLYDIKRKKFCSKSCSAKYNNRGVIRNENGIGLKRSMPLINRFTDEEVLEKFYNSKNITDFSKKLGYKNKIKCDNFSINKRLENLGVSLYDLKPETEVNIELMTKGELFDRYTQWQTARSAIAKNARKVYLLSDKPKKCICCDYDKHYEVAHIKSVNSFDDESLICEINDLDNLIALCPNHHWEYDNTDFSITPFLNRVS